MATIRKQAASNTIIAYVGVVLGYLNLTIIFPKLLTQEVFGLTQVLLAAMMFVSNLGSLGLKQSTIRFFPFFKNNPQIESSFFGFVLSICLLGISLTFAGLYFFDDWIIGRFIERAPLFSEHYNLVYILSIFGILNILLDSFSQSLFRSHFTEFYRQILVRLLNLICVVIYALDVVNLEAFLLMFVLVQAVFSFLSLLTIWIKDGVQLSFHFKLIDRALLLDFAKFSAFAVLGGNALITNIDVLMVGSLAGLEETAVYAIALAIGNLLMVPSRSLLRVANAVAAKAWQENDMKRINSIYKKSAINNLIVGGTIFLLIMSNVELIAQFIPIDFGDGYRAIIILALARVVGMAAGVNAGIIGNSKDYFMNLVFNLVSSVTLVGTGYLLIPEYGINGAAMAVLITQAILNVQKVAFLQVKYGLNPFQFNYFKVVGFGAALYFLFELNWNIIDNLFIMGALKGIIVLIGFVLPMYVLQISKDFNLLIRDIFNRIGIKL